MPGKLFKSEYLADKRLPLRLIKRDPQEEYQLHDHEFSELVIVYRGQGEHVIFGENRTIEGNYPGRARNIRELRADLDKAFSLIPGAKRLNLHAIYLDSGKAVARNKITPAHFQSWIDWAKEQKAGLDFNPTYFAHPKASANLTLSSPDAGIREYWIEHGIACRKIAAEMGKQLKSPCIMNTWIPDGFKDIPYDRTVPRARLKESLDKIIAKKLDAKYTKDAVESKVFGLGAEAYTVGSHEFYIIPNCGEGIGLKFLGHGKSCCVVKLVLCLGKGLRRLEKRHKECFHCISRTYCPRRNTVYTCVEVVEGDVYLLGLATSYYLVTYCTKLVVENNNVVAVPANRTRYVKRNLVVEKEK